MAFKSIAQRDKFKQLVKEGKMTEAQFAEWEKDSPAQLPDRVGSKPKANHPWAKSAVTKNKSWAK